MWKKWKESFLGNLLLAAVAALFFYGAVKEVRNVFFLRGAAADQQKKLEALRAKKETLEEKIRELGDPQGIEREAKARLNLKKAGEEVVVILPEREKKDQSPASLTIWTRIGLFFKNLFSPR